MDTVLLDPPLVALDKDAPVPFAGRTQKCTQTHNNTVHTEKKNHLLFLYTLVHMQFGKFTVTHMQYTTSYTHIRQACLSTLCRQLWQLHTAGQNWWSNSSLYSPFVMETEFYLSPLAKQNKWFSLFFVKSTVVSLPLTLSTTSIWLNINIHKISNNNVLETFFVAIFCHFMRNTCAL